MSSRQTASRGIFWVAVDRFGQQSIQMVVVVILARLLEPAEFGLVAMVSILMSVSQSLVDSGMAQALIRKSRISVEERSTVFWFNLGVSVSLFILVVISAPAVAAFYEEPQLTDLIRFMALAIPFSALGLIHRADLIQRMAFKEEAIAQIPAMAISGLIAVGLAWMDAGVWALAVQQVVFALSSSLFLWIWVRSEIRFLWNQVAFRECFGFGYKLMLSGLIDTIFRDINKLVLGKAFGAATLGFYTQARKLQDLSTRNLISIVQKVTYPLLSRSEKDGRLKPTYRKVLQLSSLAIIPLTLFLIVIAEPIVNIVLGPKWIASATILQITGLSALFFHLHSINLNVLKVLGRSDLFLRLEVIKKSNIVVALFIGVPLGFYPLLWILVGASVVALFINTWYTERLIGYGLAEQMMDVGQVFLLCTPTVLGLTILQWLIPLDHPLALMAVMIGAVGLYAITIRLIRNEASDLAFEFLQPYLNRWHLAFFTRTP